MKNLILLFVFTPIFLFAEEDLMVVPPQIERTESATDPDLKGNEAVYEFKFVSQEIFPEADVHYSIDGSNKKQYTKGGIITIPATAGKHLFQFYYNEQFYEIYSDSLLIEAQHRDMYTVILQQIHYIEVTACKPVIYLYPQLSTEVEVKIDIHGKDVFLYPPYQDAWNFTAQPNGDLVFSEDTYNYLFWEATQRTIISPKQTATGFFVEGKNAIPFFEDKLTQAGFNSKEQADFITYWGPRLAKNKLNFVHFEFNETCEKYAELNISPKPDNLYRIFMVWGAVSEEFEVKEQTIEKFDRSGFSVLEWGGLETELRQTIAQRTN